MRLNRIIALVLSLVLFAVPVAAQPDGLPEPRGDVLWVSGPDTARLGDVIEIAVAGVGTLDGIRADITTGGLTFRGVSSGMCASYGLVVLPQMGAAAVVYTYEVSAAAGETVWFRLSNVETSVGTESVMCPDQMWRCIVCGGERPGGPLPATPAAVQAHSTAPSQPGLQTEAAVVIAGPRELCPGDVVVLTVSAAGPAEVRAEIVTEGLAFMRTASAFCSAAALHLLPAAGLSAAVYVYRVDGAAGAQASFALTGQGALWEGRISVPRIESSHPAVTVRTAAQEGQDTTTHVIYDLAGAGTPLTVRELQAALQSRGTRTLEVRPAAGTRRRAADENVATGDVLMIRNAEGNCLCSGNIIVRGDLVGRGKLDVAQLVLLARALSDAGLLSAESVTAGDLNGSGGLDVGDLVQLARILSGAAAAA